MSECVESYVEEVVACQRHLDAPIPMFVLDSGDERIEAANASAIAAVRRAHPEARLFHVRFDQQREAVARILTAGRFPAEWIDFFTPPRTNYGAVMNKIFLLAEGLGFSALHRRDSDTVLQPGCPYPLEKEIACLRGQHGAAPVHLAGSGYVGDWNLDIKEFAGEDEGAFSTFLSCLNIPQAGHRAFIDDTVQGCLARFKPGCDGNIERKQPEAGNFALRDVHRLFPCGPADLTLGADYFTFKMVEALGYGMAFHQRRVTHRYHTGRREGAYVRRYLHALMKFCDQSPVYWYLEHLYLQPSVREAPEAPLARHLGALSHGLREAARLVPQDRRRNIDRFVQEIVARHYPGEVGYCTELAGEISEACNADYLKHAELLDAWPRLMELAAGARVGLETALGTRR